MGYYQSQLPVKVAGCWLFMWKIAAGTELTSISHRVGALKQQNTQIKLQASQEDQEQGKLVFLFSIYNKMCQAPWSPKEAVILLVFGHKNKTNNKEKDHCLKRRIFIALETKEELSPDTAPFSERAPELGPGRSNDSTGSLFVLVCDKSVQSPLKMN